VPETKNDSGTKIQITAEQEKNGTKIRNLDSRKRFLNIGKTLMVNV
jgi:hypothetical protein